MDRTPTRHPISLSLAQYLKYSVQTKMESKIPELRMGFCQKRQSIETSEYCKVSIIEASFLESVALFLVNEKSSDTRLIVEQPKMPEGLTLERWKEEQWHSRFLDLAESEDMFFLDALISCVISFCLVYVWWKRQLVLAAIETLLADY